MQRNTFAIQIRKEFCGMGLDHDSLPFQAMKGLNAGVLSQKQRQRRMLKDHSQHYHRFPFLMKKHQVRSSYSEFRMSVQYAFDGILAFPGFQNLHIQASFPVEPLFHGSVVTRKLKLMLPLKLQAHRIQSQSGRLTLVLQDCIFILALFRFRTG